MDDILITAATDSDEPVRQAAAMSRKKGRIVLVGVAGLSLSRELFYEKELTFQVSCSYGPGRYDATYEEHGVDYPLAYVRWTEGRNFEAVVGLGGIHLAGVGHEFTQDVAVGSEWHREIWGCSGYMETPSSGLWRAKRSPWSPW